MKKEAGKIWRIRKMKTGTTKQTRSKIAKATLRVGVYRIGAHPDFGNEKTAPKLIYSHLLKFP